jgi:tripartite tricarboxylate transporter family receptor
MKLPRRNFLHLLAGAAALPAISRVARAQAYPSRPVRLIAPFAPGGSSDIIARLMGQWLSERLGQPFVIENRPGAAANIGTEAAVRAPADGCTLLMVGGWNARCRTSRPWVSSCRPMRRATGMASAYPRTRRRTSSTSSTRTEYEHMLSHVGVYSAYATPAV